MKKIIFYIMPLLFSSCSSTEKIFIISKGDSKFRAYKGYFSGCRYISIKKIKNNRAEFNLLYQCDCISEERNHVIYKSIKGSNDILEDWVSVTDTTGTIKSYDNILNMSTISYPIIFRPIEETEIEVLEKAINEGLSGKCTKNLKAILGYVKVKTLIK